MRGDFSRSGLADQRQLRGGAAAAGPRPHRCGLERPDVAERPLAARRGASGDRRRHGRRAGLEPGRARSRRRDGLRQRHHRRGQPGPVWAGGLFDRVPQARAPDQSSGSRAYLVPPSDGAAPGAAGTRDAVVLELWREEISAFQVPDQLIEPALGGVDTTERIWHGLALRLLRLGVGARLRRDRRPARRRPRVPAAAHRQPRAHAGEQRRLPGRHRRRLQRLRARPVPSRDRRRRTAARRCSSTRASTAGSSAAARSTPL